MSCILLVEDEADIRTVMTEVLVEAGHEVVEAENGEAAALLLDRSDAFDMLVTDINMPGSLDGIGLAARFRKRYPIRPILYVTGRPDSLRHVAMRPNREAALFKPCGLLSLVATVRTMLADAALESDRRACPDQAPSLQGSRMVLTAA